MLFSDPESNYKAFIGKIVYLNGVSNYHRSILSQNKNLWLNDKRENRPIHISNFVYPDLITGELKNTDGNFVVEKDELFDSLNDIMVSYNIYSLIQAFEAFKRFVKYDLLFKLLADENIYHSLKLKRKVDSMTVFYSHEMSEIFAALTYCFRSLDSLLGVYKYFGIEVGKLKKDNSMFNLRDFCFIAEEIRHSVVHGTQISEEKNAKLLMLLKRYSFTSSVLVVVSEGEFIVKISSNTGLFFNQIFTGAASYLSSAAD